MKKPSAFRVIMIFNMLMYAALGTFLVIVSTTIKNEILWVGCCIVATMNLHHALSIYQMQKGLDEAMEQADSMLKKGDVMKKSIEEMAQVSYEDKGQIYEYLVHVGENDIRCFSDMLYDGFDGMASLMDTLEKDGKLVLEGDMQIKVETNCRKDKIKRS